MNDKRTTLPPVSSFGGSIGIISSKSELHRLIICACLSDKKCTVKYNSSPSRDIIATVGVFRTLGAEITINDGEIIIEKPLDTKNGIIPKGEIFCDESGSTARFILPIVSVLCKDGAVINGKGKLPERPFSDLCQCLEKSGARFSSHNLPICVEKPAYPTETLEISGNISSQYLSGLLFMLPLCGGGRVKLTTPLESSGYVDMTADAMRRFGIEVAENDGVYTVKGEYKTLSDTVCAGGDWSNAGYFLCAAKNKAVEVTGLYASSLQPDAKILPVLSDCGFVTEIKGNGIKVMRGKDTVPFDVDASEIPDSVPALSVLAASICGTSIIRNVRRLKYKESDRIKSVCEMIKSLGGDIESDGECIIIHGKGILAGGNVCSFNDHRIAMAAAAASVFCENEVTINGADAVSKSYPDFFECFGKLTGEKE